MSTTVPSTRTSRSLQPLFTPFRALREEMDDLLSRFSHNWDSDLLKPSFSPSLDMSETADALEIRVDVPGMKPDDISVEVSGGTLKISGERKEEKEEKGKTWHRIERRSGKFCESVTLPCRVREDKVQAEFHDGVLTVNLPKSEDAKTHKVKIKANNTGGGK